MEPVTVWWAELGAARPALFGLVGLLDPVERARRERYLRDADRDRFTLGVAMTRLAVAGRLGVEPEHVPLTRACRDCGEPHGPPVVDGGPHLSVSHSGDRVAVAVSPHGPLGVDVEEDSGRIGDDIARQLLAGDEPPGGRAGLLTYWTRKEALLKATGDGLRVPLRDVRVSAPDEPPRLRLWDGRPGLAERIMMRTLDPGPGYAACLALLDHPEGVRVRERPVAELLRPRADLT
ncbi:4'-phosphopantetheinyl transferase [Actinomadura sp. NBRC 104412]|uniref:4'-phosphopantetheinyl transferase family protein n=1 Tax=Actinomadura sp. NBRC 104412 TaxID=3032203 RepID=UPI0024A5C736|nr:4'-phosphopantetheinyl transferase superfamily protein [Actinomadura sp. NBRC 104412]GLZ08594.1 4'-phosphopantetheinyl transferase [Actinomadura sp. NBRC 104412]